MEKWSCSTLQYSTNTLQILYNAKGNGSEEGVLASDEAGWNFNWHDPAD